MFKLDIIPGYKFPNDISCGKRGIPRPRLIVNITQIFVINEHILYIMYEEFNFQPNKDLVMLSINKGILMNQMLDSSLNISSHLFIYCLFFHKTDDNHIHM